MTSKRKRILFTIPNFDTCGTGKAMFKIAERLDPERFEPYIACLHRRGEYFKTIEASPIPLQVFRFIQPVKPRIPGLMNCLGVARRLRAIKPDLIHSFNYQPEYSEALAANLAGIKWVFTKKNMRWGGASRNGWNMRARLAAGIAAQNTDMLERFFDGWKKVRLIPRGVDTGEFCPRPRVQALADEFNIADDERVIITVANLIPKKGVEVLLDAFDKIRRRLDQRLRLLVVGYDKSDYAAIVKQKMHDMRLEPWVTFTGKRMDIRDFHTIADIFVLATLEEGEGSPVAPLEAMACGVPVIASSVPGTKDQLASLPEQLFPLGQADALADRMERMLLQPREDIEAIREAQFRIIREHHTIQIEVERHQQFYEDVLSNQLTKNAHTTLQHA